MRRAVFLDKDGTLVENVPYNVEPERIRLTQGAGIATRALADAGFDLVVVSNQSGVARGLFSERSLVDVEVRIRQLLSDDGVAIAGFYWCPHHPHGSVAAYAVPCDCRKPAPGLLQRAARDLGIALEHSWMVGDILDDVDAGHRAGCRSVLVDNGGETEWVLSPERTPDIVTSDLEQAARTIVGRMAAASRE